MNNYLDDIPEQFRYAAKNTQKPEAVSAKAQAPMSDTLFLILIMLIMREDAF
ncbi:hypothetical protein FACS189490_13850 [Clostridia bacterium]|nr:hypothetical protein FACS189490_13850 [Clostridia bacterium]